MRMIANKFSTAPDTGFLNWIRNDDDFNYYNCIAELIDNSFAPNAGDASTVTIHIRPTSISIYDDGKGVENFSDMFTLGQSTSRQHDSDIGLYGVGAKGACIWIGDRQIVKTKTINEEKMLEINWTNLIRNPQPFPELMPKIRKNNCEATGTEVHILGRAHKQKINVPALIRYLSNTYEPAIRSGKTIVVVHEKTNGETSETVVERFAPIGLTDIRQFEGQVNGKPYSAVIGILSESINQGGLRLCFGHRVVETRTALCGTALPVRIFGYVYLSKEWKLHLGGSKTLIQDTDELEEDLRQIAKELLALADEHHRSLHMETINAQLSYIGSHALCADANGDIPGARRPTNKGKRTKTKNPHPTINDDDDGDYRGILKERKQHRGLRIEIRKFAADDPPSTVLSDDSGIIILLNESSPLTAAVIASQQKHAAPSPSYAQTIGHCIANASALRGPDFIREVFRSHKKLFNDVDLTNPGSVYNRIMTWWESEATAPIWQRSKP